MNTITKILIIAIIVIVILFTNVLSFNGDTLVLQFPSIQFFLEFLASQNFVILVGIFGFFFMFYIVLLLYVMLKIVVFPDLKIFSFVIEVLLCSTKLLGIKITNIPTIIRDNTIKTKTFELIYITL